MMPGQARTLEFIRRYYAEFGYSPSYQEIQDEMGLRSKSKVHQTVHALIQQGRLVQNWDARRNLRPAAVDIDLSQVPTEALILALSLRGIAVPQ